MTIYVCPYCRGEQFAHKCLTKRAAARAMIDRIQEVVGPVAVNAVLLLDKYQATCDGCGYSVEYNVAVQPALVAAGESEVTK